jgi:dehydrogenase/reductase SDR family member 12
MGQSAGYSAAAVTQWYLEGSRLYGGKGFEMASRRFRPSDLSDMSGKVVLITGANKGIGYAAATSIARLNAKVYLLCRDAGRGETARDEIIAATGNKNIHVMQLDVSSYSGVRKFADCFKELEPSVDVLVNNAGNIPSSLTLTDEGNESITATVIGGSHLLTALMVPALSNGRGRVVNVSSGGGYSVRANVEDVYCKRITKYDGTLFYAFD